MRVWVPIFPVMRMLVLPCSSDNDVVELRKPGVFPASFVFYLSGCFYFCIDFLFYWY